jgi:hypothetical protein
MTPTRISLFDRRKLETEQYIDLGSPFLLYLGGNCLNIYTNSGFWLRIIFCQDDLETLSQKLAEIHEAKLARKAKREEVTNDFNR